MNIVFIVNPKIATLIDKPDSDAKQRMSKRGSVSLLQGRFRVRSLLDTTSAHFLKKLLNYSANLRPILCP